MRIDLSFVTETFPLIRQLATHDQIPEWNAIRKLPSLDSILENGRVVEENNRPLAFEEWSSMWMDAATRDRTKTYLGIRQQFMFDNMRTAVLHLTELEHAVHYLQINSDSLGDEVEARVLKNLPAGATLPDTIRIVLGTTSSGYVSDEGIFVDLVALYMFHSDPEAIRDFLTHESWHFGHGSFLETHPKRNETWFMPLAQLQSEGIVNYLVGGTYQLNQFKSQHSDGEAQEQARRFVEYANTMEDQLELRLRELFPYIEKLMTGDMDSYITYTRSLPDIPGYLHGVLMSKAIDEVFNRNTLISSVSDPIQFVLLSIEALKKRGLDLGLSNSTLQHWTDLSCQ